MNKLFKNVLNYSIGFLFVFSLNIVAQEIEEVVVTATKKAESVQDLAISIEAFTAESLEKNLVKDSSDLFPDSNPLSSNVVLVLHANDNLNKSHSFSLEK